MTTESMSADHPLAARRRALFDRIIALPQAFLPGLEAKVADAEMTVRSVEFSRERAGMPPLTTTRVVAGATITERPDIAYAAQVASGPVTAQAPEPERPAELAKVGGARQ